MINIHIRSVSRNDGRGKLRVEKKEQLFCIDEDSLRSAYLYWKFDRKMLLALDLEDIAGSGLFGSMSNSTSQVRDICGFTIQ
jgi:hypothetical protein